MTDWKILFRFSLENKLIALNYLVGFFFLSLTNKMFKIKQQSFPLPKKRDKVSVVSCETLLRSVTSTSYLHVFS